MYWKIFIACYVVAFVVMFAWATNKQASVIRMLERNGAPEQQMQAFRAEMFPRTVLMLIWSTFVTGSLLGGAISGVIALMD